MRQARGEMAVREEFPDATIVRPATFFGHEDHFLNYYACMLLVGLPCRHSFGSSHNLVGEECVTSQKNVCVGS